MKYIDADKLLAEIERLKKHSEESKKEWIGEGYNQNAFAEDCRIKSFDKLLAFIASLQQEQNPKVKGYGVMRKMEDPHPVDWYMDENGKEHCWGYKFNEPCPWPAEVYIMEAKDDDASDH